MMADFPGGKREEIWEQGRVKFHKVSVDDRLKRYINDLTGGKADVPVLVTWCGKSLDVPWLCSKGYNTVGVELTEVGVKQLFQENNIPIHFIKGVRLHDYKATDRMFVCNFYRRGCACIKVVGDILCPFIKTLLKQCPLLE